jgi:hypothetical protein
MLGQKETVVVGTERGGDSGDREASWVRGQKETVMAGTERVGGCGDRNRQW